jgi:hypothetical protein
MIEKKKVGILLVGKPFEGTCPDPNKSWGKRTDKLRASPSPDRPFVRRRKEGLRGTQMKRNFNPTVEKMLGQILVEGKIISPVQLQVALDRQKNPEPEGEV